MQQATGLTSLAMASDDALVYVVDDEAVVRDAVTRMAEDLGYACLAFDSAEAFLGYQRPDRPACLLLDVMMPGTTGLDVFVELQRGRVMIPTIFITGEGTIPMSVQAMKAGAVEFLTKPIDRFALRAAIEEALARARELQALTSLLGRLTAREREVLALVVRGRLNKQIAAELDVVEQTVKVHRSRVMEKLGAGSVADLVRLTDRLEDLGLQVTTPPDHPH